MRYYSLMTQKEWQIKLFTCSNMRTWTWLHQHPLQYQESFITFLK